MARKKGTVVPNKRANVSSKGTIVHLSSVEHESGSEYAAVIAAALRSELGNSRHAIKSASRWTGASERTVKYWFTGARGPSGDHLIALARHSDAVLTAFLDRAQRPNLARSHLLEARDRLLGLLAVIQEILNADSNR